MLEPVLTNPWVRAAGLVVALAAAAFLLYLLSPVLVPLFFAFLVAYVFDPVVDVFEKLRIRRMITILCLALIALMIALAIPLYLLPSLINEADHLVQVAQQRVDTAEAGQGEGWLYRTINRLPLDRLVEALGWAPEDEASYDPLSVLVQHVADRIRDGATQYLESYGSQLVSATGRAGTTVAGLFAAIGRAFVNLVLAIGNIALFAFVAGYLLKDYDTIIATARDLIPPNRRQYVGRVMGKIDDQLRGFLRGQALVCLALGIMYSIGLVIAGVPFGLFLGILGGVASFIPYLGLILTIGPAVILCLVQYAGVDWHFGVVIGTFVVAQTLEGTVITPKVVGDQVGLGPVWVILAVLVFGNALGFLGLLLAVPIAATLKVLVLEGVAFYKRSELFSGSAA